MYYSTEYFIAKQVFYMAGNFSLVPLNPVYPTFYYYFLIPLYGIIYLAGHVSGFFPDKMEFVVRFLTDPSIVIIPARFLSLLFFLASLLVWYRFYPGKREKGKWYLLFTMAFFPSLFLFSFQQMPDMLMLLLVNIVLALWISQKEHPSSNKESLMFFIAGLAVSTKYNSGFLPFGLGVTYWINNRKNPYAWKRFFQLIGLCLVGFFIGTPGWLSHFPLFWQGLLNLIAQNSTLINPEGQLPLVSLGKELFRQNGIAGVLILLVFFRLLYRIRKKDATTIGISIYVLFTIATISLMSKQTFDYIFPVLPPLFWMIAETVESRHGNVLNSRKISLVFYVMIVLNFLLFTAKYYHRDTREILADWIQRNRITTIVYDHYHIDLPFFDIERYTSRGRSSASLPQEAKNRLLNYVHHPMNKRIFTLFYQKNLSTDPGDETKSFKAELKRMIMRNPKELDSLDVDIVVLNGEEIAIQHHWKNEQKIPAELRKMIIEREYFYQLLNDQKKLVKHIRPGFFMTGPEMKVYQWKTGELK